MVVAGGQTCITAAAAAQPSPQDPYQMVYPEITNDSSNTPKLSPLSIYWVLFKSKGKQCRCSFGVVMQSLRGQRHGRRATPMQQWSTGVPCRAVPCFHVPFGAWRVLQIKENLVKPVSGVEIRFLTHDKEMLAMHACRKRLTEHRKHTRLLLMFAECTRICWSRLSSQSFVDETKTFQYAFS